MRHLLLEIITPLISDYWDYWHKSLTGSTTEGIDNLNIAK